MRIRLGDLARVLLSIAAEVALLIVLWKATAVLGSVDFSHLGAWVRNTDPTTAVLAVLRLAGMIFAAWMLLTTVVYLVATLAGAETVARRSGWVTLPFVRRMIDAAAAASIVASTLSPSSGSVSAAPATAVVQPFLPPGPIAPAHQPTRTATPAAQSPVVSAATRHAGSARHLPHPGVLDHAALAAHSAPAPTVVPAAPSAANGFAGLTPGTKVVVVQPGQCLSVIAEEHLAGNWRTGDSEIHALNVGRLQPDGRALTDDHWIYPGWVLVMPDSAVNTLIVPGSSPASLPAPPTPDKPAPPPSHAVPVPSAPNTHTSFRPTGTSTVPTPATSPVTSRPAASIPSTSGRPARSPSRDATSGHPTHAKTHAPGSIISLPSELVGAGVLAAGLITLLTKLTLVASGRRRRGRRTSSPTAEGARLELAARIGADFDTMDIVDLGCKFLAVQLAGSPPSPPVVAVEATDDWLAILLGETVKRAPDGFTVGPEGQSWILEQPDRLFQIADQLAQVVAPFPSLVSLGRTDDGITIFLNLGALGFVSIEGDPHMAAEAVTAAAVELATVPWSQQAQVILVGFGHADGLGVAEPVTVVDSLEECLARLQADSHGLQATAAGAGAASLDQLRLAGNPTDLDPSIVVCLEQPDQAAFEQLASTPTSGLGAVMVAGAVSAAGWTLKIDHGGRLNISELDKTVEAQRIPLPLFDAIEERIASAADTDDYPLDAERPDWWPSAADDLPPCEVLPIDEADLAEPDPQTLPADTDEPPKPQPPPAEAGGVHQLHATEHPYPSLPPEVISPLPDILVQVLTSQPQILRRRGERYEPIPVSRARALEAIVYLACHPAGVTSTRLAAALQPELTTGYAPPDRTSTFGTVMSTARKALGAADDGSLYLPHKTAERFRLADGAMLDWHILVELQKAAQASRDLSTRAQLLAAALNLVGDEAPFAEIRRVSRRQRANQRDEHWRWFQVEFLVDVEGTVTDVAGELAELYEQAGDHLAASAAARKGLQTSPLDRTLRVVHLSAEAARGPAQLQQAWEDVQRVFETEAEPYDRVDDQLRRHYLGLLSDAG